MYIETGLGQPFKQRSPYKPRLENITVRWSLEIPFRKDFRAFGQEISSAIGWPHSGGLVRDETDRKKVDVFIPENVLKQMHNRLLKRKSPKLKEFDVVKVHVDTTFRNEDYTGLSDIAVKEQR
jgi:hypothetical protein